MSAVEIDAAPETINLDALETWLDDLPKAEERREQEEMAGRAAKQLEALGARLGDIAARLPAIQAGLVALSHPTIAPGAIWGAVQDALQQLPKIEITKLASFGGGHGRTLPNEAERLGEAVERHWRVACDKLARETLAPLRTLRDAMARDPATKKPKADALAVLMHSINKASEQLVADPATTRSFLALQRRAQEYLVLSLSGASNAADLVRRLADGELRLGSLSEEDLVALRRSLLAHAILLKL
jgi:hypothetical protein